jgi:superfamily II DNA or RNA helicase
MTAPIATVPGALYAPGSLVRARDREWIVLPGSSGDVLRLRPLSGSEEDVALVHTRLEPNVTPAVFPPPSPAPQAGQDAALLLRDALLMSLRRGAGPFRSFGNLALEPRAYQLVPLLMALRQETVRLLVADDVGIGKTIEAALIARELYDRGEIARFAVLCPPHLVDQWVRELDERFHLKAAAVTANSAARLERGLPVNESIFTVHPFTVVSLDYIKSERRRADFVRACPELVIVDEAHTCTNMGTGRQLRYELLRDLSKDAGRHMVLLTATPHSGNEEAFYHLLGLLDPEFGTMHELPDAQRDKLRERLARHFVQRRRPDIDEWMDTRIFAQRETAELTYRLGGAWEEFFEAVLDYCADITEAAGDDERRRRLTFWGTLALMRCVSSSPRAAVQALRTRMGVDVMKEDALQERVFDGAADELPDDDVELGADNGDPRLRALVERAATLEGPDRDPKLTLLLAHVKRLVEEGFSPVVFCRYVATAHYVAHHVRERLRVNVDAVTGELPADERVRQVEALGAKDGQRVLVATDCLSEGINLQEFFDAVVHYDLSWNPTRHEQREGRVDRYGQKSPVVRATLIYGENNPVDGAVLQVIIRKAESIRKELGVPVPIPDDDHTVTQALMQAVLLRRGSRTQRDLFAFEEMPVARDLEVRWTNLAEKAKRNRTVFAQRRIKPEEVLPEWRRMQAALGAQDDVRRFVQRAMSRLNAGLEPLGRAWRAPLGALPAALRERLEAEGLEDTVRVDFAQPAAKGARFVHRSHPLVGALADDLLERALAGDAGGMSDGLALLGRAGVWRSTGVEKQTTVLLLRLRHQITATVGTAGGQAGRTSVLLVEEALPVALVGRQSPTVAIGEEVAEWLAAPTAGDLPENVRHRVLDEVLGGLSALQPELEAIAARQADALLADHRRVRQAAEARGRYDVKSLTPVDVVAVYVLLPAV